MLEIIDFAAKTYRVSSVALKRSPIMMCFINHAAVPIILDTGAENNVIGDVTCKRLGLKILQTSSQAQQVDKSPLKSVGRVVFQLENGDDSWHYDGLVCSGIGDIVIAGNPLLVQGINPVTYKNVIEIVNSHGKIRTLPWRPVIPVKPVKPNVFLLKVDQNITIYPEEYINLKVPPSAQYLESSEVLITPRLNSSVKMVESASNINLRISEGLPAGTGYELIPFPPPHLSHVVGGIVRVKNTSPLPIIIPKHSHIADMKQVSEEDKYDQPSSRNNNKLFDQTLYPKSVPSLPVCEVNKIALDPDNILKPEDRRIFKNINEKYSEVFMSKPGKYNGVLGNLDAKLVLGNVEPPSFPCKKIIQSEKLDDIKQGIMDQMEADGILARPENVGIQVTHVHESYLVPKMEDGQATGEYRLVTNLQSLSPYLKPTRLPLPTIDEAFRKIGRWRYIIILDLRSWHWQIPIEKSSMRYLGTSTPYGGDRVYTVQPQGYLNATENADRVILRVLEPAIRNKQCVRMADNMILGGNTPAEAAANYELVLKLCGGAGLTFKASKTIICPQKVNILGRIWENGSTRPSDHLSDTLSKVSPPTTVKQMRSFLGGAKQMKENLPNYSDLFHPLERVTSGRKSGEKILWNDNLREAFGKVQNAVKNPDYLTLAKPKEKLFIYPDWSDEAQSGGAPMYVFREGKWLKVRNFTQRLKAAKKWSPCEGEAWIIRVAVENHGPWICQSGVPAEINTDSAACVLSFQRLRRGQFSRSVRVAFLLSTLAEYNVYVVHRAGSNHPGDYDSRHAVDCSFGPKCQVCIFAHDLAGPMAQDIAHPSTTKLPSNIASKKLQGKDKVLISSISMKDVLENRTTLPFTQRNGWKNIQDEDKMIQTLRRHMENGTIPQRRGIKQPELKKLYNLFQHQKLIISRDGLIMKTETDSSGNIIQQIVVPNSIMRGILTALHVRFDHPHPSNQELKKIVNRYWYATNSNQIIQDIFDSCTPCQALKPLPKEMLEQSTTESGSLGSSWSADILRSDLQYVFIAREKLSSFTVTKLIPNEKHDTLREALVTTTLEWIPSSGANIQVDNASSLVKLVGDAELNRHLLKLNLARKKNKNSNPIAEKAVQEFRREKLKFKPEGGALSDTERALITASLNKKIRNRGVSSKEIIMNRDQNTLDNLNLDSDSLKEKQLELRQSNHPRSEKCKSKNGKKASKSKIWLGALVFLKQDLTKLRGREMYIVVRIEDNDEWCWVKKSVKQLRVENYRVKRTEICLAPNQREPLIDQKTADDEEISTESEGQTVDQPRSELSTIPQQNPDSDKSRQISKHNYNLRNKPKINYKVRRLHGSRTNKVNRYPPKYGWDSHSDSCSSSDERETQMNGSPTIVEQFEEWCSNQEVFTPKSSIFLHWFRDKYPDIDILKLETAVKELAFNVTDKISVVSNTQRPNKSNVSTMEDNLNLSIHSEDNVFEDSLIFERSCSSPPFLEPTAKSSSTCYDLLSPKSHVEETMSSIAGIDMQTRRYSVIRCPTDTCDISNLLSPNPGNTADSPSVSFQNYPLLHRLAGISSPPRQEQKCSDQNRRPSTPYPDPTLPPRRSLRSRNGRLDYHNLHNFGREGPEAWLSLDGEEEDL